MKSKREAATEKFLAGYNCAQAVLHAFSETFELEPDTALKLACGLGAGMARRGEVCGGVTGGILVLGLRYGRGGQDDRSFTDRTYQKTQELMAGIDRRHGSCRCRELLRGCDLTTAEGQAQFKQQDLLHKTCLPCVQSVVELLEGLLEESSSDPCSPGNS
jgi:C_GCAxxG_C_C family probable redox protein